MGGGSCIAPARCAIQFAQSSHQVIGCVWALASHSSGSAGNEAPDSTTLWIDLGLGGLTIPAICPELESTKRTSPAGSKAPRYELRQGAMWSCSAARK